MDRMETEEYLHVMCEICGNEPATTSVREENELMPACQPCADATKEDT